MPASIRSLARHLLGALLALALLANASFEIAHANDPPDLSGDALFVDGQGQLDRLELRVSGLPTPPADTVYAVWASSDDGELRERLSELPIDETGIGSFGWSQPTGESLLAQFSQVFITHGPAAAPASDPPASLVALHGRIDAGALTHMRRLLVRWPDSRYGTASMLGIRHLAGIARQHMDILQETAATGNVTTARRKAEHLLNLIEGQRGDAFGDPSLNELRVGAPLPLGTPRYHHRVGGNALPQRPRRLSRPQRGWNNPAFHARPARTRHPLQQQFTRRASHQSKVVRHRCQAPFG